MNTQLKRVMLHRKYSTKYPIQNSKYPINFTFKGKYPIPQKPYWFLWNNKLNLNNNSPDICFHAVVLVAM